MAFAGAEDPGALVVDIGSGSIRVGWAGHDVPGHAAPCVVAAAGASARARAIDVRRPPSLASAVRSPLVDGVVDDWEGVEGLLLAAVERLRGGGGAGASASSSSSSSLPAGAPLAGVPVILAEHLYASKADRERWAQLLLERHGAAGLFCAKAGVLALYANARTTGIAVDMGAAGTQVTPVQDGYALMMGARLAAVGGRALDGALAGALEAARGGAPLRSKLELAAPPGAPPPAGSLAAWHRLELARDVKEAGCRVSDEALPPHGAGGGGAGAGAGAAGGGAGGASGVELGGAAVYELPDGTSITLGPERTGVPEVIFQPGRPLAPGWGPVALGGPAQGLPDALLAAAMACEPDLRRELVGGLVLTGGASRLAGLQERLVREFAPLAPVGTRARWAAAAPEERSVGPWVGGSILGSLGAFHEMWFSAAEYREHGARLIHRKCP